MIEQDTQTTTSRLIDILIRLGFLAGLILWCFKILSPFLTPVLWGSLLSVVLYPVHKRITIRLKGKSKLSAALIVIVILGFIVSIGTPVVQSTISGIQSLSEFVEENGMHIPPPSEDIKDIPVVGDRSYEFWSQASKDFSRTIQPYQPEITAVAKGFFSLLIGTSTDLLLFMAAVILAGILLTYSEKGNDLLHSFYSRLVGTRAEEFSSLTSKTIVNVAVGVVGVALIQGGLAAIGFFLADVPYAGIWSLLVIVLAVIQLPPFLVILPVIIYLFSVESGTAATLWTIYFLLVGLSDNVLKPILLGKGSDVPMLVIFMGSLGGFMNSGFVGLFVGAVVLSLGYTLFIAWIKADKDEQKTVHASE